MIESNTDRPVLIVDVLNAFMRAYVVYPAMSTNGHQVGGCIGFLKILRKLVNELQPSNVYLAWEGGGSQRRRKIFPQYKLGRKPERLNRFYGEDIPDTDNNKQHQLLTLVGMLRHVPVCQVYASDCEGDDIVAYVCKNSLRDKKKVIASSDKDMYQLLEPDTKIYSFHKKLYITEPDVLRDFRVTAKNFAIAKALCGDPGDNVPGIKGLGFKTVAKLYPFLGTEQDILLQDVIDYANSHIDEHKIHKRVVEQQDDLRRNWKLVYLDGSMLSATQAQSIDHVIDTFEPKADKMGLIKTLIKEGVGDFDVDNFYYSFNAIDGIKYKSKGTK